MSEPGAIPAEQAAPDSGRVQAVELAITGQVQGVGFRPFVHRLATSMRINGVVWNDATGVGVRLYAQSTSIERFIERLQSERPPLARIDTLERRATDVPAPANFSILESAHVGTPDRVTVDCATCEDCTRELFDPKDHRHRHALINCTNCGPRYTIVHDVPYDRVSTTMATFPMCPRCAREYKDPLDRRFHAQPTCCPDCGPTLRLVRPGVHESGGDPIAHAATILRDGGVLAIKGLGGYHLAVDATNVGAVATLRARKHRDHKPFAVMAASITVAHEIVELSPEGVAALTGTAAPIVLALRRAFASSGTPGAPGIADGVAPGIHRLGVMLPHTPVQHLLMRQGFGALVMTSANASDDPLITDDAQALTSLADVADAWLMHDRAIARAVDDSVVIDSPDGILPIRRARGFVPSPIRVRSAGASPGLCVGAELKSAVAVVIGDAATGNQVIPSQHLGDLQHALAYDRFRTTIDDLLRLFRVAPQWIARDAHPAYLSHRYAGTLAKRLNLPLIDVQHHHAHMASVLAEHHHVGPAVGLICDGVGYGEDGSAWGGEVLVGDCRAVTRRGRTRPLRLPGGDAAAKDTTRCALAWLYDAIGIGAMSHPIASRLCPRDQDRAAIFSMLARGINAPESSGVGRLFDAAAAILGVCERNHYEAMSGMLLEAAASGATSTAQRHPDAPELLPVIERGSLFELDHRPLLLRLLAGLDRAEPVPDLARLFHDALADGLSRLALRIATEAHLNTIVLSGGVFCNTRHAHHVRESIESNGLRVLTHREVPSNDGGVALGQAAVAIARLNDPIGV